MTLASEIGAPDDPRVDDFRHLTDQRYRRALEGDEFLIAEGPLSIDRLLDSSLALRALLCSPKRLDRHCDMIDEFNGRGGQCFVAAPSVLEAIVGFDLHRGVVASARRPPTPTLDSVLAHAQTIALVEGINDPENLGAIARAARALFVDALVLDPTCTDPFTRRNVRVSMGEVLHLPITRVTEWEDLPGRCADAGFELWALTPDATADNLWTLDQPQRVALAVGAEGPGLSDGLRRAAARQVQIPIADDVDSLNVGHAAAIAFAAVARRR
ncbi:MAG: RNA methyltransferase [Actinomycetota bacterium]